MLPLTPLGPPSDPPLTPTFAPLQGPGAAGHRHIPSVAAPHPRRAIVTNSVGPRHDGGYASSPWRRQVGYVDTRYHVAHGLTRYKRM
eukprot:1184590-Prorocentrum_minimum.AAC.3